MFPSASSKVGEFKDAAEDRHALAFFDGSTSLEHAPDHGSLEAARNWLDVEIKGDRESILECMNFFDYDKYEKEFESPWRRIV